ncbi:YfhE family protein [Bacillus sp. JJ1521]
MPKDKRREKSKSTLSSMQAVTYQNEFKRADKAGGYTNKQGRH